MRKKGLYMLALGYLGGIAIAMKFSKKTAADHKNEIDKKGSFFDVFVSNFAIIHKDIFKFFEQKIVSDDNLKVIENYKKRALDEVESFKKEANKKLEELKEKGIKKKDDIEKEIVGIYEKRQKYFEKAVGLGEEYTDEAIEKGKEYLNEGRKRLDRAFEEIKKKMR